MTAMIDASDEASWVDRDLFGHTRKCLARAIICAVENARDIEGGSAEQADLDHSFRLTAQAGFLATADDYLREGSLDCSCPSVFLCPEHGAQPVIAAGATAGFSGALIRWATLTCGCQAVDASADTLEAVR